MKSFKLLTWNILGAQAGDLADCAARYPDVTNWLKKFKHLVSKMVSFDVDIICLQEVDVNTKKDFESAFAEYGFHPASYEPKKSNGGAFILYKINKFNLINHHGTPLKINDELGACAWATLQCKQTMQKLLVASIHLHWQFQKEQLQILAQTLQHEPITIPTIIAGDFNITYPTMVHDIVPYLNDAHIMQQQLVIFEHSSWTTQPPHHQDQACLEALDHVLHSGDIGLEVTNSFVANPEQTYKDDRVATLDMVKDPGKDPILSDDCPSDHLPIVVTFDYKD